uniref:mitogen-activated protein kinase kinase n=2 Tax=Anopheles atroparvus TaxID=41427 RepID=A0AAG5D4P7_ANOAO
MQPTDGSDDDVGIGTNGDVGRRGTSGRSGKKDEQRSTNNGKDSAGEGSNSGFAMSTSSIDTRITMMERMIQNPTPRTPPPPTLALPGSSQPGANRFNRTGSGGMGGGSGPNRPTLDLHLPIVTGTRRSESELKFQKIIEKSGLLKINEKIYRTQLTDLEDLGELGNGTSGHVVKMRHKPSGAIIAVKQMRRTGNDEENKRIIMDLDVVLKSENCKYIVKCLGCFITDADVWICMELMTTCFDKLQKKSKKPVPEEILGKVTVATVRALAYLKDNHRVIHRDVKPSNILIDDRGNIKLCDFGISGRLIDSNARTRSAGCAAYMAPERIDPAKTVYDIRADVWSLGITLVELATGVFPYRGCVTDFEVLTQVLTSKPPRLPEDQNFSPEFRDFVQLCLRKDYQERPKYPDLLRHAFLQRAEHDSIINVSEWFRNVAVSCGIQLTSPPPAAPSGVNNASAGSSPGPWTGASEQTRIPTPLGSLTEAVQAQSNQQKQTIAIAASSIPIKSTSSGPATAVPSPHLAHEAPSNYQQQQQHHNNLGGSRTQQQHSQQQILQSKLSNIHLASAAVTASGGTTPAIPNQAASSYSTTSSSPVPAFDPRRSPSPQAHYLSQMQPKSAITSTSTGSAVVPIGGPPELARKYKHSPFLARRTASEYGSGSPKKESTLSSLGQSIFKNLTTSPFAQRKSLPPGESKLAVSSASPIASGSLYGAPVPAEPGFLVHTANGSSSGSNPSSPLLVLRKAAHHDTPGDTDTQYKHLQGNTSPIVLQRFYHQQNQLMEQQREALHHQQQPPPQPIYGNQQQQHQQQVYGGGGGGYAATVASAPGSDLTTGRGATIRYSPLPSHRTVHHGVHPVLTSTLPPHYAHDSPPSGIPVYQPAPPTGGTASPKHKPSGAGSFFSTFSRGMKSASRGDKVIDRGGGVGVSASVAPAPTMYGTAHPTTLYQHHQFAGHQYPGAMPTGANSVLNHRHGSLVSNGGGTTAVDGLKEEQGWFNSIAGLAKRSFASIKLNLGNNNVTTSSSATIGGDRRTLKEKHLLQQQQQQQLQQHYQQNHFDPATTGSTTVLGSGVPPPYGSGGSPFASSMVVQPPSAIPSHAGPMSYVLGSATADRRHRSPDPPPRLNRGQSPLLLQRKLEQLGHTGSPLLNRRPYNSTSPSPPLPPRRGSESVPGSPQHLRTRINYTPEPHRRPYRTTIDQ